MTNDRKTIAPTLGEIAANIAKATAKRAANPVSLATEGASIVTCPEASRINDRSPTHGEKGRGSPISEMPISSAQDIVALAKRVGLQGFSE